MNWTADYLELLQEYAGLCNLDTASLRRHIDSDPLGFMQFKQWADCL
jgi:hypothetical protein